MAWISSEGLPAFVTQDLDMQTEYNDSLPLVIMI